MTRPDGLPPALDPRLGMPPKSGGSGYESNGPAYESNGPAYDPNAPAYNPGAPVPNGTPSGSGLSPSSVAPPSPDGAYGYNPMIDSTQTVTPGTTSGMATPTATSTAAAGAGVNGTNVSTPSTKAGRRQSARGPRRAKLQLRHVDPWSTLKLALILSIALFFVWMVAVGVLYGVLSTMDVFEKVNGLWSDLQGDNNAELITPTLVFGGAALIGAINIVLFTALATVGSFIYNLCADLVGGLEITLAERR